MSKRKYRPGQVGEEAARLMEEEPMPFPKGLSRLGQKIWRVLDTPDHERDRKMSDAVDRLFAPHRPNDEDKSVKNATCENT